jgi:hypothetical protein
MIKWFNLVKITVQFTIVDVTCKLMVWIGW